MEQRCDEQIKASAEQHKTHLKVCLYVPVVVATMLKKTENPTLMKITSIS